MKFMDEEGRELTRDEVIRLGYGHTYSMTSSPCAVLSATGRDTPRITAKHATSHNQTAHVALGFSTPAPLAEIDEGIRHRLFRRVALVVAQRDLVPSPAVAVASGPAAGPG